jgi:hypothetical protein
MPHPVGERLVHVPEKVPFFLQKLDEFEKSARGSPEHHHMVQEVALERVGSLGYGSREGVR